MGEQEEIEYSAEELAEIENLTSFFNNAPGTVPTSIPNDDTTDEIPNDSPSIGAGLDDDDDLADPADFSSNDIPADSGIDNSSADELGDLDLGDLLDDADATPADEPFNIPDFNESDDSSIDQPEALPNMDDLGDEPVNDPLDLDNLGENPAPSMKDEEISTNDAESTEDGQVTEEIDIDLPDIGDDLENESAEVSDIPNDIGEVANLAPSIEDGPDTGGLDNESQQVPIDENATGIDIAEAPTEDVLETAQSSDESEIEDKEEVPMEFSLDDPPPMDMAADVTDANNAVTDDLDMMSQGIAPLTEESSIDEVNVPGDETIPDISDLDIIEDHPEQAPPLEAEPLEMPAEPSNEGEDFYSGLDDLPPAPDLSSLNPGLTSISAIKVSPEERSAVVNIDPGDIEPLSNQELQKLRQIMREYSPGLRQSIISSILDDKLFPEETEQLLKKVLKEEDEASVKEFLERLLGEYVSDDSETLKTKMIASRPEYTTEGMERQAKLLKLTRFGSIAAISLLFLSTMLYQVALKPIFYRNLIKEGKDILLQSAPQIEAVEEAEILFQRALEYYPYRNYAFLQYADAYKSKGMYGAAFKKLFADIEPAARLIPASFDSNDFTHENFWKSLKRVPVVRISEEDQNIIHVNNTSWLLHKPGAYLIDSLYKKELEAETLIALGKFHSNHVRRFRNSPYRNNELGIDYLERILTFDTKTPSFQKEALINRAILSIGDIYYYQRDFYQALDYYEKIIQKDPTVPDAQAGVVKTLLRIFAETDDPRLVLQQHSIIKHQLSIEEKMPLYLLAQLAAFYIDLPDADDLRIRFNVLPEDAVNGRALKDRASELLDLIFSTTQEDEYGNVIVGPEFAEGYYQRGRFYRNTAGMMQMAMKQMEYAYKYNPKHFLALNDRAEMLIDLEDYNGAIEHLRAANEMVQPARLAELGDQPEDETLLEADHGVIPFNLGKAMYLSLIKGLGNYEPWTRINETDRFRSNEGSGIQSFQSMLDNVEIYFDQAKKLGLKNDMLRVELFYFSGWSKYVKGDFRSALADWEQIPIYLQKRYKNLNLAKSHALYKLSTFREGSDRNKYLKASLGYLNIMRDHYARARNRIGVPDFQNRKHVELYMRSSILENNMGAIFEMLGDEDNSQQHYWKSIDFSKQVKRENEAANLNLKLSFRRSGLEASEQFPVIMDFISPNLQTDSY
jgi:tetratricopeptide (TPR) repeat protein